MSVFLIGIPLWWLVSRRRSPARDVTLEVPALPPEPAMTVPSAR
jgi:hypothetical protein